jgi:DNA-binding NarL/FixJ family response regulator
MNAEVMKPEMSDTLRILVADDHEVVRRGVRNLLESQAGWTVCAEATNGREAVEAAKRLKPDIVILDIGMEELNGLEAARQIRRLVPESEILILTIHESEDVIREVLAAGARGYVLKSDAGRDLVTAIGTLRRHKPFLTARVAELMLDGFIDGGEGGAMPAARRAGRLTPREREFLQLLAEGRSNKEIAGVLGVSVKTAETHRKNIMRKLDLHSAGQLVRYAIRHRIIEA